MIEPNKPQRASVLSAVLKEAAGKTARALEKFNAPLHPLDDPQVWLNNPMYAAPSEVDLVRAQSEIDSIVGTTRGNEPIIKVVWNGDRRYWLKFFMSWNASGMPDKAVVRRPLVRYKALRDNNRKLVRDVFPPRFLLLSRIEPEQFASTWKQDSYVFAPEINRLKQIRPSEPPSVLWLWYATIARHTDYCCATAARNKERCYGDYAPPSYCLDALGQQVKACAKSGLDNNPFKDVDASIVQDIADENNGYVGELMQLQVEAETYIENPLALLGVHGSLKADIDPKRAKQIVKDFYDKEIQETAKLI